MSDTKQLNVRLPVELHKLLDDHKIRTGEDKSEIIRRGIEAVLTPGAKVIHVPPPRQNGEPKPETVELAAWLAGRLGMPRALMRRRISEKRVTVDGEVFTQDRLEKTRLGAITVDGIPVKAPPGS